MKLQTVHLAWQGRLSIEEVGPLRDALLTALSQHDEVNIDVAEVAGIDLACLQLLCSACGSASIRGKRLRLKNAENPVLTTILQENGLDYRVNCLRSCKYGCLWSKEQGVL